MHDDIPWQVFAENGEPIVGKSALRGAFAQDESLILAASNVWVWRKTNESIEVLLQKRAHTKSSWPSYWDISVSGHVDANETFIESGIREAKEEIGMSIDGSLLRFIFSLRTPLDKQELDAVYLYELTEDFTPRFDDGEVEELDWISLDTFKNMIQDPDAYSLVPQGEEYFGLLMKSLERVYNENN
jgi:isopentenyl-diphosphate Delta-isomerase